MEPYFDETAQAIARRQYFMPGDRTILDMFRRVAREIARPEGEKAPQFEERFFQLMASKRFSPGGRVLAGAGTAHGNLLNCFVQGATENPPESLKGIHEVARKLALVTKVGGGNGVNLDPYRPARRGRTPVMGFAYMRGDHRDAEDFVRGLMRPPLGGEKVPISFRYFRRIVYGPVSPELGALARAHGVEITDAPPEGTILVPDDLGGIVDAGFLAAELALKGEIPRLDLSALRPEGAPIRGSGGTSSGPVSFLFELYENLMRLAELGGEEAGPVAVLRYAYAPVLRVVRQGGVRRGAGMATLSVEHPDVLDFLTAKDLDREGAEGDISTFNISLLIPHRFMELLDRNGTLPIHPRPVPGKYERVEMGRPFDGELPDLPEGQIPVYTDGVPARWLFREIAKHAWATGEPGLIFIDRVNEGSAVYGLGPEYVIKSTNPCFVGSTRIPTEWGLLPIQELAGKGDFFIVTDNRALLVNGLPLKKTGVTVRRAAKAFPTGLRKVVHLRTVEGLELTLTPDHLLLTPEGYVEAGRLKPGDRILVQSGEGLWSKEVALPEAALKVAKERVATAGNRFNDRGRTDVREQYANLPTTWSHDLGLALGFLVGDGYVRERDAGFYFSREDFPHLEALVDRLRDWFGPGSLRETSFNTYHLSYRAIPAEFFQALGVRPVKATEKRVPESIFRAPREAVVGFLRGLFSADGTVERNDEKQSCSVRLSSSSLGLLQDVQLLLLNFGILGRIHKRRNARRKPMPDGKGGLKEYETAPNYELIIGGESRNRFAELIGFALPYKQEKLLEFIRSQGRGPYRQRFEVRVKEVVPAGEAPVYDLTEPATHSLIANGVVAHNCGEIPLTVGEPCDLGALNLAAYVRDGSFDWEAFREDIPLAVRFLDNVLEVNRFVLPDNEAKAKALRRLGLGVMGLADMLIRLGLPYDSEEARLFVEKVMDVLREEATKASEALAEERGPFPLYEEHREFFQKKGIPPRRNVALLTVAPTGTTSMIMGVSSGIEPIFAPFIWRRIGNEYRAIVHPLFQELLEKYPPHPAYAKDGRWDLEKVVEKVQENGGSLQGLDFIPDGLRRVFLCAHDISPLDHVRMQGAIQRAFDRKGYVGNSLSKTINLPHHASPEDVEKAYYEAYRTGCKGITVYRDGSREGQVLNVKKDAPRASEGPGAGGPSEGALTTPLPPLDRPGRLFGFTDMVKLHTPEGLKRSFLITVNLLEGRPVEVILTSGKAGDEANADSEALGRVVSIALQHGVPAEALIRTLRGINGGLYGSYLGRLVASKADLIAIALESALGHAGVYLGGKEEKAPPMAAGPVLSGGQDALSCPVCGAKTLVREEGCLNCKTCGYSKCG